MDYRRFRNLNESTQVKKSVEGMSFDEAVKQIGRYSKPIDFEGNKTKHKAGTSAVNVVESKIADATYFFDLDAYNSDKDKMYTDKDNLSNYDVEGGYPYQFRGTYNKVVKKLNSIVAKGYDILMLFVENEATGEEVLGVDDRFILYNNLVPANTPFLADLAIKKGANAAVQEGLRKNKLKESKSNKGNVFEIVYSNHTSQIVDGLTAAEIIDGLEAFDRDDVLHVKLVKKNGDFDTIWTEEEGLFVSQGKLDQLIYESKSNVVVKEDFKKKLKEAVTNEITNYVISTNAEETEDGMPLDHLWLLGWDSDEDWYADIDSQDIITADGDVKTNDRGMIEISNTETVYAESTPDDLISTCELARKEGYDCCVCKLEKDTDGNIVVYRISKNGADAAVREDLHSNETSDKIALVFIPLRNRRNTDKISAKIAKINPTAKVRVVNYLHDFFMAYDNTDNRAVGTAVNFYTDADGMAEVEEAYARLPKQAPRPMLNAITVIG